MRTSGAQEAASSGGEARLVILAAGKGTRMLGLTENTPKPLIRILEDRCILEINVANLARSKSATNVRVVGGHAWTSLKAHLERYAGGEISVEGILNADYDVAGPCRSIQLALTDSKHCDRIIIANGDTIFSDAAFRRMNVREPGLYLLGSRTRELQADDLIIDRARRNFVRGASKANADGGTAIISSGMFAAVGAEAIAVLSNALTAVLKREKEMGRQLPWHDILGYFWASGTPAQLRLIDRSEWYEFDSASCIARFRGEHEGSFLRT